MFYHLVQIRQKRPFFANPEIECERAENFDQRDVMEVGRLPIRTLAYPLDTWAL